MLIQLKPLGTLVPSKLSGVAVILQLFSGLDEIRSLNAAANKDTVFPPQKKHQLPLLPDVLFGSLSQWGAKWWRMNPASKRRPQALNVSCGNWRREVLYCCSLLGLGVDVSSYWCCLSPESNIVACVNCPLLRKLLALAPHRSPGDQSGGESAEQYHQELQGLRPADKYILWITTFWGGGMCILPSLPACYYQKELGKPDSAGWIVLTVQSSHRGRKSSRSIACNLFRQVCRYEGSEFSTTATFGSKSALQLLLHLYQQS